MNLRKIIQEEVAKINEAMMTKKFMKATEELQKVQLRRQELKKKFVAETEPSLKEKLKQQLIKIHKEVQKAEAKFNSAIMSEPIDLDEKYTEAVIEEGKLNEIPKGAAKGKGGTTPAPINRWWENDKRQLMSIVYHAQRQLPPSDRGVYNREYLNIVNQLQKKFPAPPEILKIKLKEATVDKSISERIKSLTPEQKSRLKEKLISKYKK